MGAAVQESNLAWDYDQKNLYGHYLAENFNTIPQFRGGNTTETFINESQHLMVWMRPSAHATVRKLYGVINTVLEAGASVQLLRRFNRGCSAGPAGGCSVGSIGVAQPVQ